MIRAEELMVGDLVKFPHGIDKVCDLPYVEGKGICASFAASATLFPVPVEALEPIPLTPEILEKNGFEKLGYDGWEYKLKKDNKLMYSVLWRCDYPNALRISSYSSVYGDFNSFHIDNVHELQHALRLCGINLEIKL